MKWLRCLFYRFSEQLYGTQIANSHSTVYSLTNIVFAWPVEWKEALQWNQMKCSAASMTFRITCNGRPDPARTPLMMTSIVMRLGGALMLTGHVPAVAVLSISQGDSCRGRQWEMDALQRCEQFIFSTISCRRWSQVAEYTLLSG